MFSPKVLDRAHVLEIEARTPSDYIHGCSCRKFNRAGS